METFLTFSLPVQFPGTCLCSFPHGSCSHSADQNVCVVLQQAGQTVQEVVPQQNQLMLVNLSASCCCCQAAACTAVLNNSAGVLLGVLPGQACAADSKGLISSLFFYWGLLAQCERADTHRLTCLLPLPI